MARPEEDRDVYAPSEAAPGVRCNAYKHPAGKPGRRFAEWLANHAGLKRLRRRVLARLPFPVLASDVTDVLYLNWLVSIESAKGLVPGGVTLWESDGRTILTVLTYRHGHFGPAFLGPLRRWLPSPLQSNWRFYVSRLDGQVPPQPTVLFVRNFFDSAIHAIGTRVGSDALPSELPSRFSYGAPERFAISITNGAGEVELEASAGSAQAPAALGPFSQLGLEWRELVTFLTQQETAVVPPQGTEGLAQAGISLPIDVSQVQPMKVDGFACGPWLQRLVATSEPFAFLVPRVHFRVLWEKVLVGAEPSHGPMP